MQRSTRYPLRWIASGALLGFGVGFGFEARAVPITIDDFEHGAFAVEDTTPGGGSLQSDFQAPLPVESVLGGVREESTGLISGSRSSFELTITGGDDAATATVAPDSEARADLYYDGVASGQFGTTGPLDIDLTAGGELDRIVVDVVALSGDAWVSVGLSETNSISYSSIPKPVGQAGVVEFALAEWDTNFGLDVTHIDALGVTLSFPTGGETISIRSIRVVPEPSIAVLIAVAAAALGARAAKPNASGSPRSMAPG